MAKTKKRQTKYYCEKCKQMFYVSVKPNECPLCGSKSVHIYNYKTRLTAMRYIAQMYELVPQMEAEITPRLRELYREYKKAYTVLNVYANRGIIGKDEVPRFNFGNQGLLNNFYLNSHGKKGE